MVKDTAGRPKKNSEDDRTQKIKQAVRERMINTFGIINYSDLAREFDVDEKSIRFQRDKLYEDREFVKEMQSEFSRRQRDDLIKIQAMMKDSYHKIKQQEGNEKQVISLGNTMVATNERMVKVLQELNQLEKVADKLQIFEGAGVKELQSAENKRKQAGEYIKS